MENRDIFNQLQDFVVRQAGVDADEVIAAASIEDDLGIYGDDAVEFIASFGKAFQVDVSKFMAAAYFRPEGDRILPAIIRIFTRKEKQPRKSLTIAHLEKAILAGRLDEDVINS